METKYFHPDNLEEAVTLLEENEGAVLVNGGSDIIPSISAGKIQPTGIIDLRNIKSMNTIADDGQYVHIGGNVTYRQIQISAVCNKIGGLLKSVSCIGSPAIRSVATAAGNIATAAPSADCASMLLALNTELVLVSSRGERIVKQKDIYIDAYKTDIKRNEIIKEMRFPSLGCNTGSGYARFSRRKSQDIAKIIAGAVITIDKKGQCEGASISLGALNATAVLAPSVEDRIVGLNRDDAVSLIMKFFPREAGLRESYFKKYKEETTCYAIAEAVHMAFTETQGRILHYAHSTF
ncbi:MULTISPECIES: FAD binding domain-containing protein [unclassified Clostridium]|jgi:CO/xanthine dehydrogenase FAD-binding subunit|uniref:FAD binding domain-containing protein n=1 Tax=unclassified Clostridium TaxID=2614128 RepID=UPI001106C64B|nr:MULTISPECIES: FAD binding domain-containing protein [unclassified Clostridium]